MGGRGSASGIGGGVFLPAEMVAELPYEIQEQNAKQLGGATYPFLENLGRAWRLLTLPIDLTPDYLPAHTFGQEMPALRWVNGDKIHDLFVDGMDTEQLLAKTGLKLSLDKGGFVLSKRLSRLMRPYFVSDFFEPDDVKIAYLEQTEDEAKIWDGAGLVSRAMLQKMMLGNDLSSAKRIQLEWELKHAKRVEFTVMTPNGQDKGHAIVAEDLRDDAGNPVDFLLPQDTKGEISLHNGKTWVGFNFVHGHNQMRLDIQSLINLHPFFEEEQLLAWLKDEGDLFLEAIQSGEIREVMGRIDPQAKLEDIQRWSLKEYLASGGHPMWFRTHVKALVNQHLKRLNHQTLGKMRLPLPGGRHYVMPASVGERAGISLTIPVGEIQIEPKTSTAWVNDEDWLALKDSPKATGIAGILGGADNDDALWLHPFTDYDGEKKVLAWRSPNQVGEYVILRPIPNSAELAWIDGVGKETKYPKADSRKLPARTDMTAVPYLGLVDANKLEIGKEQGYTVGVMDTTIDRALANKGALGMTCNSLMLQKALFDGLPKDPPAPLEEIIDSAVKTGADLSQVVLWNYAKSRALLEQGVKMPALLWRRLSYDRNDPENRPPAPQPTTDHWLDRLEKGIKQHIGGMLERRNELMAQAMPPPQLFERMADEAEMVRLGRRLNQVFAGALNQKRKSDGQVPIQQARLRVERFLSHFPPSQQRRILLGALVSVHEGEMPASDAVAWLSGDREVPADESISHRTIQALREIGILDELIETAAGIIGYPPIYSQNV